MLLRCRPLRFSISFHRCCSETPHPCLRSSPQAKNSTGRSGLEVFGNPMVRPNHSLNNQKNFQTFERMHERHTSVSQDATQHPSSVIQNFDYKSEFPTLSESVNLSNKSTRKTKTKVVQSPQTNGSPLENRAYIPPLQHGIPLEVNSLIAGTSVHTCSNHNRTFGCEEVDGVTSCGISQASSGRSHMNKVGTDVDPSPVAADLFQPAGSHSESRCDTHPLENALSLLVNRNNQTEQRSDFFRVNSKFHAKGPAMHRTDSEPSSMETQDVRQGFRSHSHDPCSSSCVKNTATKLQDVPTLFGKRNIASTGMYHTQSRSRLNKGRSENSNMSQLPQKMKPFDICESSLVASPVSENKEMWVKKLVTDGPREILRPGMVLLKNYIPLADQVKIVRICRELGLGEGGFYQPGFDDGRKLHLQMMCLGLDWDPQTKKYGERRRLDGARPPAIPENFTSVTEKAINAAHNLLKMDVRTGNVADILPHMNPNICIVNFYDTSGRLGLHQDKDESMESLQKGLPVVSISLGDTAEFLYGDERDIDKAEKVLLESGDVLIFGGSSRHIFHGVASIFADSAPATFQQASKLRPGRLNLTFREF